MSELTERARQLASGVEVMGLPNYPDCSLRDCADTLRALCDENDQLRAALRAIRAVIRDDGDGAGPGAMFDMIRRRVDAALDVEVKP